MFRSLGLFGAARCPEQSQPCHRPWCFFAHAAAPQRKPNAASAAIPVKRKVPEQDPPSVPSNKPRADHGPPTISRDPATLKSSPQPYADRQKALTTLYTQFCKLYSKLDHPGLAAKSALAQEAEISSESENTVAYKRTIHSTAVSILRRPPPDSLAHPSVGTVRESRSKTAQAVKDAQSRLSLETCEKYCLAVKDFALWGYPDPTKAYDNILEPDAAGTTRTCDRCQSVHVVGTTGCVYHFGRLQPEQVEGRRKWIFNCCGKERGEPGCQEGRHVFTEKDDEALDRRAKFVSVAQECGQAGGVLEVVGMDCEMIYTTAGLSLARVTVTDENGEIVLDEIVRQKATVLDVNTRFSGLDEKQLSAAVMDLPAVRAAVCMLINASTIIVGHGLENDLRAIRLLHDRVIDTATIFPHPKGPPYRRALRDLTKEKLGYFIQERTSDKGHSSAEDARAALEVLKWKVRDDMA